MLLKTYEFGSQPNLTYTVSENKINSALTFLQNQK